MSCISLVYFGFQAEDGIRDLVRSRGLGDVYKRQLPPPPRQQFHGPRTRLPRPRGRRPLGFPRRREDALSLIHI